MNDTHRPPEAELIERVRQALTPKLSVSKAAKMAGISEGRWRQIAKGYQQATKDTRIPVSAPAETLARMALTVGATPEQLEEIGREDAARLMRIGHGLASLMPETPRLPRNAYFAPVLGELDIALGQHPNRPGPLRVSGAERQLLTNARNKLVHGRGDLTDDEQAVLTKFIEDDELRTLHVRIDWLPRAEQLHVSALVNDLQLALENRWVADGYDNESERLPDYARPNPLPREGIPPDPRDFPTQVPGLRMTEATPDSIRTETMVPTQGTDFDPAAGSGGFLRAARPTSPTHGKGRGVQGEAGGEENQDAP